MTSKICFWRLLCQVLVILHLDFHGVGICLNERKYVGELADDGVTCVQCGLGLCWGLAVDGGSGDG